MQNLKLYKFGLNERKRISNYLGLNCNKTVIGLKTNHIKYLKKKLTTNKKLLESVNLFNSFSAKLKNYKYFRNISGYPSRGQRTHTNAKTKKKNQLKNIF